MTRRLLTFTAGLVVGAVIENVGARRRAAGRFGILG